MAQKQVVTIVLAAASPDHVYTLQQILQHAHITNPLLVFHEPQEVLAYLSPTDASGHNAPVPPVLLLLDLTLRHHNGTDLFTHLRADDRTRHLPIILLTTAATVPDTMPVAHQASVWVTAPLTSARFVEALRALGLFLDVVISPQDTG